MDPGFFVESANCFDKNDYVIISFLKKLFLKTINYIKLMHFTNGFQYAIVQSGRTYYVKFLTMVMYSRAW